MSMKFLLPLCAAAALLAACSDRNKDTAVGGNGPSETTTPATPPADTPPPAETPPPSDTMPPPDTATPDTATPPPPEGQPANPPPGG